MHSSVRALNGSDLDTQNGYLPMLEMQEMWALGQEDPLEKGMATHSYSCLGNPLDRRDWQATVHGVTKSWTRLSD